MPKPSLFAPITPMLSRSFNFRYFEDPEASRTANTGDGNAGGATQPDLAQVLQTLAARHGGSLDAVGMTLLTENHGYRQRIRELEGRMPGEGAVVLTGEEAQRWQAYQALGAPTDVQAIIADRDAARGELTTLQRTKAIADAAGLAGYKAKVLGSLPKADTLAFIIKDESENGQTVQRAYVKDGDTEEPLTTYAEREWQDFLPALLSADTDAVRSQARPSFVRQQAGGKAPVTDPIATHSKKVGYALPGQRKEN